MSKAEPVAGAIYDIGYQHYDGKRLGRVGAVRAVYVQGLRTVFGIGRGVRAKIPPIALIAIMVIPAVIQAALAGLASGQIQVFTHAGYFRTTVWVFGLFCAFQAPELVTGDVQYRVLSLYFSRALLRSDYVLARVGALASALFIVGLLPHVILLFGQYFASDNMFHEMHQSLPMLPHIVAAAFVIAILLSTVSFTVAAVIRRRPFATAAILALFLLASAVVIPLVMTRSAKMRYLILASPMMVGDGVTTWIFDTTTVRAPVDSAADAPIPPLAAGADSAAIAARREAVRRRRRRREQTPIQVANLPGPIYLATLAGFVILAAGVLTFRFRSIET